MREELFVNLRGFWPGVDTRIREPTYACPGNPVSKTRNPGVVHRKSAGYFVCVGHIGRSPTSLGGAVERLKPVARTLGNSPN
jgi:hypothetical protein